MFTSLRRRAPDWTNQGVKLTTLLAYRLAGISLCDALGSNGRAAKEFAALTDAVEGLLP